MTTAEHPLTLYNSLTRKKEQFIPQDPKRVTMYNCGPTVYSYAHIGNARAAVVADVLFRVLRHIYGEDHVVYARNITDVDDRIIQSAKETGKPISEITEKYAKIYNDDLTAIGCLQPTSQPKATEHIGNMIEMISELLAKDFAYTSDGHVFFDVSKYDDYGKLSGNTLEALRGGDRVGEGEVARKRNAADFVLWKPELDGVGWDAPFGKGRPGWHIECSAMSKATLGETIDIHCGGVDLKFPHHENEIAQSCCANEKPFAKYWVHNEFLNMGSEKMSKSLGNVTLIHDLLKDWDGEVIRLALLRAHYRGELNWSPELLNGSRLRWEKIKSSLEVTREFVDEVTPRQLNQVVNPLLADINTANAVVEIGVVSRRLVALRNSWAHGQIVKLKGEIQTKEGLFTIISQLRADLIFTLNILGFPGNNIVLSESFPDDEEDEINDLIQQRDAAKMAAIAAKKLGDKATMGEQFKRSDEIRDKLKAQGIVLEDGPDGTTWRRE